MYLPRGDGRLPRVAALLLTRIACALVLNNFGGETPDS